MAHSKGGNGVNVPDEFMAAHVADLPAAKARGKEPTVLDPAIMANVRRLLTTGDRLIASKSLYGATVAELTAYNNGKDEKAQLDSLVKLAMRFAAAAARGIKRYADTFVGELADVANTTGDANTGKPKAIGVRLVNEGTDAMPAVRWYLLITTKREREETAHGA